MIIQRSTFRRGDLLFHLNSVGDQAAFCGTKIYGELQNWPRCIGCGKVLVEKRGEATWCSPNCWQKYHDGPPWRPTTELRCCLQCALVATEMNIAIKNLLEEPIPDAPPSRPTKCKWGHLFTPENTIISGRNDLRRCRICTKATDERGNKRKRLKRATQRENK